MVELLVVIGIIGVLASLLVVAVSSAKRKSQQTTCLSNLRQNGQLLSLFVNDFGEFPISSNLDFEADGALAHHRLNWVQALIGEGESPLPDGNDDSWSGVFDCPAYRFPKSTLSEDIPWEYGYNASGSVLAQGQTPLGLGGHSTSNRGHYYGPPVKEHEVVAPARMRAIGDSMLSNGVDIRDGLGRFGRSFLGAEYQGSTKRSLKRHGGRVSIVYVDGHAEAEPIANALLTNSDGELSSWNRDGLPHAERVP